MTALSGEEENGTLIGFPTLGELLDAQKAAGDEPDEPTIVDAPNG